MNYLKGVPIFGQEIDCFFIVLNYFLVIFLPKNLVTACRTDVGN